MEVILKNKEQQLFKVRVQKEHKKSRLGRGGEVSQRRGTTAIFSGF